MTPPGGTTLEESPIYFALFTRVNSKTPGQSMDSLFGENSGSYFFRPWGRTGDASRDLWGNLTGVSSKG